MLYRTKNGFPVGKVFNGSKFKPVNRTEAKDTLRPDDLTMSKDNPYDIAREVGNREYLESVGARVYGDFKNANVFCNANQSDWTQSAKHRRMQSDIRRTNT
jgi:hypothetical protein